MAPRKSAALRVIPEDDGGLTLEDLFSDTVTFDLTIKGRRLEVTWAPARYTPALEEQAMALTAGAEDDDDDDVSADERERRVADRIREENRAIREFLAGVLVSWSLHSRDGTPVGVDLASLLTLPAPFLKDVFAAMVEGAGPKDATEPPSAPSS